MKRASLKGVFMLIVTITTATMIYGQNDKIKGTVLDANDQQPLPFCNIQFLPSGKVISTDRLGQFRYEINPGDEKMIISFVGYRTKTVLLNSFANAPLQITLEPTVTTLQEIQITGIKTASVEQFENIRPGEQVLRKEAVMRLPALAGEPDFIKALTLLPGATRGLEGSSDFFIRGGDADQNLVMLDGATVYNTGHLFGFLSVFNPSAVGEVSMMTGGFPAEYGGRLSSVIDVRSKELNKEKIFVEGGIGLISSRVSAEIPVVKDKLAIQLAGRRTYADQVVQLADIDLPYYFYDVNFNLDWEIKNGSRLHYGFYLGDDVLDFDQVRNEDIEGDERGTAFTISNLINTLSLHHQFSERLSSRSTLHMTRFNYDISSFFQDNFIDVASDILDYGFTQKFSFHLGEGHALHSGFSATWRTVDPNLINSGGEISEIIPPGEGEDQNVLESAVFAEWEFKKGRLEGIAGLRASAATVEQTSYINAEPRIALRYPLPGDYALKASYTRMSQYVHRVSSSSFALPTDVWYPVDDQVRPQNADQVTLGLSRLFVNTGIVASSEVYYKRMYNLIEFREGTNLVFSNEFRDALIQGNGESYGLEFLLRKDEGRLKGWLSYTLSRTVRQFDKINFGREFPARYDRRHNLAVVTNYDINKRWAFSLVWEFISGARFTPIIGYYGVPNATLTGVDLIPIYPERNSVALQDSHRLDLSIILKGRQAPGKRWFGEWQFSVYNAYNRATPIAISLIFDEEQNRYRYEQPGLFGLLPSISYHFKFN